METVAENELIMGLPVMNFQMLLGMAFFVVTYFLVKLIRGIQTGRYPCGAMMFLYLRTLLWIVLIGGAMLFFGAIFGFRYI